MVGIAPMLTPSKNLDAKRISKLGANDPMTEPKKLHPTAKIPIARVPNFVTKAPEGMAKIKPTKPVTETSDPTCCELTLNASIINVEVEATLNKLNARQYEANIATNTISKLFFDFFIDNLFRKEWVWNFACYESRNDNYW